MSPETLAQYGPWAMVAACFAAIAVMGTALVVLYREVLKSHARETELGAKLLPLVSELLAYLSRRR